MSLWIDVAQAASALNVALLVVLGAVWGRSYRRLRSKHALGLLVFGGFLLVENVLWVYVYTADTTVQGWLAATTPGAQRTVMGLCVLETVGLLVLTWITWD